MKLPPVLSSRHKEAIFLMKRMLCVLLTLLLCAASAQADAVLDTVDYDNAAEISTKSQDGLYLYVVLEDGTAGITGYLGDETALVIPSVVDDLPVTAIGAYAFEYAALTSVVIPEGVTVIDCEAFAAASALKEITLPSTLREIGEEAFIGCALEKVTLSEGVETLGERAFAGCWNLQTITLPNTLRRMGYGVFADCDELWGLTLPASLTETDGNPIPAIPLSQHFFANSLRIAPDNPVLRIENQMLLAGDTVICAARDVRDVTVPEGITTIGRGAFYSAQVERVTLPEGLTNIQKEAFNGCFALRSVSLPESLQSIGDSAFDWCRSLTEITLPEGLRTIGCHAFESTGLTALKLPESLEEVGHGAFFVQREIAGSHAPEEPARDTDRYVLWMLGAGEGRSAGKAGATGSIGVCVLRRPDGNRPAGGCAVSGQKRIRALRFCKHLHPGQRDGNRGESLQELQGAADGGAFAESSAADGTGRDAD